MSEERRLLEQIIWKLNRNEESAYTVGVFVPAKIDRKDAVIREAIAYLEANPL